MKFCGLLLLFVNLWCGALANCRMRDNCATIGGFPRQCSVDIEAPVLIDDLVGEDATRAIEILNHRCPTFTHDSEGNRIPDNEVRTCCTLPQLIGMTESLQLAEGILGRCPACFRNFARQICEMNCSPDQSRFLEVETETTADGIAYVETIAYRLHEDFMVNAHASCAGVVVPQTGVPAINMMCGAAPVCDADAWFGFLGDTTNNPLAPVQVDILRWPTTEDSMSVSALTCNETYGDDPPCSCADCSASCPIGTEPVVSEQCTILSVNCIGFGAGIAFFVLTVIIFIIICLFEYRSNRLVNTKSQNQTFDSSQNSIVTFFQTMFSKIGGISASYPVVMIMLTTWLVFAMSGGILSLNITANPIELWSAPNSRSRQELDYFNSRFGPFYRAAQVFLTFDLDPFEVNNVTYGPAFRFEAIKELIKLEDAIIDIGQNDGGVTLQQVCYAPVRPRGAEQRLDECVSMSVSVYLGNSRDNLDNSTYLNAIQSCLNNHFGLNCLASWGGGSDPELTFGGYEGDNILSANTLLINFPISNFNLEEQLQPVLEWEQNFINLLHNYIQNEKPDYVTVAFGAERSVEDEIRRVSVAEVVPISISYVLMFIYVMVALGNIKSCKTWFLDSKIAVGLCSILVVLGAIASAIGTMGYAGITLTLLAINVIPFFVLSVGIDNVFLMVNALSDIEGEIKTYKEYNEDMSFEKKRRLIFEKMFKRIGPSIFVSSVTQITCFAIGSLANFPAVVTFAIFASLSLTYLFIFQITTVVAILSIDYKRSSQNRYDLFFCIQKKILDDEDPLHSETPHKGVTKRLMEPYSKFILNWRVKIIVVIIFMFIASFSTVLIPQIEIGLDQQLALPRDSYVYSYLEAVNNIMMIGPPVYFVLKGGLNMTNPEHQNVICGGQLCNVDSLFTQVFLAAQHSDITYLERGSNSWLDDFVDWTNLATCCRYNITNGGFCQSTDTSPECAPCVIDRYQDFANGLRPSKEAFQKYIPFFLQDSPSQVCTSAGLASYSSSVNYVLDSEGIATVHDTNFMAYHSPLGTSKDYITAIKYGYEVSANITEAIVRHTGVDVEVFPYSVFYVFYEQYLYMWGNTWASIGYCLLGAVCFKLLASGFNLLTTFAVIFTSVLVLVNMMGVMYIWSIPLNAVSLVNLIVSIGIAVEFCTHMAYAFATSNRPPGEKTEAALQAVGPTIITGITFTNIPIIVLAFSYTELIEIFFFRMNFSLVILAFLHGMVFFPVLLSYLEYLFIKKK